MGLLANSFRDLVAKSKDPRMKMESQPTVGYSTGFLNFDFANGTVVHVRSAERSFNYYSIGVPDGCLVMLVGRSGCGKTTWAVQAATNIIKPFPEATIFHDDIEGGLTEYRKERLSGFHGQELKDKYISRDTGITAENFYERVRAIYDLKMANYDALLYDTGCFDQKGDRIFKLQPTPYILDSVALLMPEKFTDEDEVSGSMAAAAVAKSNSASFKRIQQLLKAANIILFLINHVNKKIDIGPVKTKSQVSYFKQDESIPGGNTIIYLTNLLIKFDDKEKLFAEKGGFGINGSIVDATFIKSRNNRAGQSVPLVFNQGLGFDPELSLFVSLEAGGVIKGSGAYYTLDGYPTKFMRKDFKDKLAADPDFATAFTTAALQYFKTVLDTSDSDDSICASNVVDEILSKVNEHMVSAA